MVVRAGHKSLAAAIAVIDERLLARHPLHARRAHQVAETTYQGRRLIVRRTRLVGPRQLLLWPDWRHFAFLTALVATPWRWTPSNRSHATIELAIRDPRSQRAQPRASGKFAANSAWLQCAVLAHDLIRWTATIARTEPVDQLTVARSVRRRLIAMPARLVNHAGTLLLRCPLRWPWRHWSKRRLAVLRALQPVPGWTHYSGRRTGEDHQALTTQPVATRVARRVPESISTRTEDDAATSAPLMASATDRWIQGSASARGYRTGSVWSGWSLPGSPNNGTPAPL